MSTASPTKKRRRLVGCALLLVGAFLALRWFSSTNQLYLDRAGFPAPDGRRELIMIYKRDGLDISRLFFVRDAPPEKSLISLGRGNEPTLVVWSGDGTVVALADIFDKGARWYYEAYDFQTHQHIVEEYGSDETSEQRQQRIAALLKNRGGAATPAARQNHEIGADEQDQWRAVDPELN